jgi:transcriptional regulator GlxA family with amidase domain
LHRLEDAKNVNPLVVLMLDRISRTGGAVRLKSLATETGYRAKHLIMRFRDHVGTSPKQFARLVRFQRAQYLLARGRGSAALIAAVSGFADQAHLTR